MLILTRKRNESIKIGGNILIKVVQTKAGLVKLGIEAPTDIRVLRAELPEDDNSSGRPSTKTRIEVLPHEDLANSDCDCYFQFGSEHAAEVEDQMYCVATD